MKREVYSASESRQMGLEQRISDAICFTKKQAFQDCNKFEKSIAENRRRARLLHRLLQYSTDHYSHLLGGLFILLFLV
jgi:hypothetical protein